SHRNPTSTTWRTHTWEFYDENSVWTRIAISDVIDPVNSLRYEYQSPSVNRIWTFTPRTGPVAALGPLEEPPLVVANEPDGIPIGTLPVTQSVALTPESASAFDALLPTSPPQYALHIEGLRVPGDRQAIFQVYINLPEATAQTGVEVPNYA